jgi:hypothetical protein
MRTVADIVWTLVAVEVGVIAALLVAGRRSGQSAWAAADAELARLTAPLAPPRRALTALGAPPVSGPRHASREVAATPASYVPQHRRPEPGPVTREFDRIVAGWDAPVIGRPPRDLVGAR